LLYIGPEGSHISDLLQEHSNRITGWSARHGSVDELIAYIQAAATEPKRVPEAKEVAFQFSSRTLLPRVISIVEEFLEKPALSSVRREPDILTRGKVVPLPVSETAKSKEQSANSNPQRDGRLDPVRGALE